MGRGVDGYDSKDDDKGESRNCDSDFRLETDHRDSVSRSEV
jgi:hypothetical protein